MASSLKPLPGMRRRPADADGIPVDAGVKHVSLPV